MSTRLKALMSEQLNKKKALMKIDPLNDPI